MAPPNDPLSPVFKAFRSESSGQYFDLSNGKLSVKGVPLLSEVPSNVTFRDFHSPCQSSDAPLPLLQRVRASSHKGAFLGFNKEVPSDRLLNSLGKLSNRDFLSIFRFKTWWSTMWVGNSGSNLQMETQWVLLDVPEIKSYVIIIPIIEANFRSALHPGSDDHVMICAESGSSQVKASNFDAIAYVNASDNPYNLMKEAYSAVRVHLNSFRLLEEKTVPNLVNKFGWCTWDAFYLNVEPVGVWHGLNEFIEGGVSPRFLIIDDGWQSINMDDEDLKEETKKLVHGGTKMIARLHRFEECKKFRNYRGGSMLGLDAPSHAEKDCDKALHSGVTELSVFETKLQKLKIELNEIIGGGESSAPSEGRGTSSCSDENYGMRAFTGDLRTKFKGLDDIYVWHAICGAWGGVRPGSTHLSSKIIPCKVSPGLDGTMNDSAVVKIVESGIGLVHPDEADSFYD
ncbi:putative galactinol--raffinose galactosyltransferase [Rosa chinensis]|uniref:Putative galactinol--raffinose galactosyltransferase n=1 Tax=Rosa chinensis TaxID=74649 RepID=A0A2P6RFJ1_ROSCH|nr:putative galactinol--raffinose galactosyltransferase [Rosa chinensis]